MDSLAYVAVWVMFSVLVGVAVGYCLGASTRHNKERQSTDKQREETLQALVELLRSTEQLTTDVDSHNLQMKEVHVHVGGMKVSGELESVQRTLLSHINDVMVANQKLEDDLVYARSRMEEQAQEIDRTRLEARTDALSGVANRKSFDERLQFLLTMWRREGQPFVLVLMDIDHFKRINDTHGHQAGDQIVTHVGNFLRECSRANDYVARYGGDEFALLLPNTHLAEGHQLVEQIRVRIAGTNFDIGMRGELATVTFSIGLAEAQEGDVSEAIIQRADQGLYAAKRSGRNQVQCAKSSAQAAITKWDAAALKQEPVEVLA